jgi:carboxyl-terminal processing protease
MRWTVVLLFLGVSADPLAAQLGALDRGRAQDMLAVVKADLQRHYYDSTYRGLDLDREFRTADSLLKEAPSINRAFAIIARTALRFQDSHTRFLPPSQTVRVRYGWDIQAIGDSSFVVGVAPGSDADALGVKVGDRVVTIQGVVPDRSLLGMLDYLLYSISPTDQVQLTLESPSGEIRSLTIASRVVQEQRIVDLFSSTDLWAIIRGIDDLRELRRNRFVEVDKQTLVWRLPSFDSEDRIDEGISRSSAYNNLILDLRGNRGGAERVMLRLLERLLEHETVIDTLRMRDKIEVKSVRPHQQRFKGALTLLIDSRSASASEIVAGVVQLEKRGIIIGDRSAGAVMRSRIHSHRSGTQTVALYATSVTDADVILRDGTRLEGVGVLPDVRLLPTGSSLAAKRDPAMDEALRRLGYSIPAEGVAISFPPQSVEVESW